MQEAYDTNWMTTAGSNINALEQLLQEYTHSDQADWYQHDMSNVITGVVRGQMPYLDEHIAQKKAIYERYKEGLKDIPIQMNPFDETNSVPNYW